MAKTPSGRDEDGKPFDDAVDFDLRFRQLSIRKRREGKRAMQHLGDELARRLQEERDKMTWVDEKTRRPL